MAKTNTVIEINGKRYDAINGQVLSSVNSREQAVKAIDGVVRSKHTRAQPDQAAPAKPAPVPVKAVASIPVMDMHTRHRAVPTATPKKHMPQSSKTLMRQAVSKPAASFKKNHKSHTRTDVLASRPDTIPLPKLSIHAVDTKREARASRIGQSKLISRFGSVAVPEHKHIEPATIAAKQLPKVSAVTAGASVAEPMLLPSRQPGADLFEQALLKATSHEQPAPKDIPRRHSHKKARRLFSASALSAAVLILGGFFVYQNMANITIRMAASRAGFAAALPGYRPAGYAIGKFAYSSGNVTIRFHSNSDNNRSFALIEQPSNWDSTTLVNDYVSAAAGNSYQTATAAGRTIYLYGSNNATWVSGGVWYRVDNQNGLSTAQLVDLASSM